jgi:hypothetical protein
MDDLGPMPMRWSGEAFEPATPYQLKRAGETFSEGKVYTWQQVFDRSPNSHRHYFAQIHEAWMNLPENLQLEYPTSEHLRKKALIMTGHYTRQDWACNSKAEAIRTAAILRSVDEYAVVQVIDSTVSLLTAKSQASNKMRKKDFQESKTAVLGYVWGLCGVDPETGEINTGAAA